MIEKTTSIDLYIQSEKIQIIDTLFKVILHCQEPYSIQEPTRKRESHVKLKYLT